MCSSAFTSRPCLLYHNPIANIAVMSMYRQSGGETAGFRTEVNNTKEPRFTLVKGVLSQANVMLCMIRLLGNMESVLKEQLQL